MSEPRVLPRRLDLHRGLRGLLQPVTWAVNDIRRQLGLPVPDPVEANVAVADTTAEPMEPERASEAGSILRGMAGAGPASSGEVMATPPGPMPSPSVRMDQTEPVRTVRPSLESPDLYRAPPRQPRNLSSTAPASDLLEISAQVPQQAPPESRPGFVLPPFSPDFASHPERTASVGPVSAPESNDRIRRPEQQPPVTGQQRTNPFGRESAQARRISSSDYARELDPGERPGTTFRSNSRVDPDAAANGIVITDHGLELGAELSASPDSELHAELHTELHAESLASAPDAFMTATIRKSPEPARARSLLSRPLRAGPLLAGPQSSPSMTPAASATPAQTPRSQSERVMPGPGSPAVRGAATDRTPGTAGGEATGPTPGEPTFQLPAQGSPRWQRSGPDLLSLKAEMPTPFREPAPDLKPALARTVPPEPARVPGPARVAQPGLVLPPAAVRAQAPAPQTTVVSTSPPSSAPPSVSQRPAPLPGSRTPVPSPLVAAPPSPSPASASGTATQADRPDVQTPAEPGDVPPFELPVILDNGVAFVERQTLEDTLVDLLLESARRHGIEI